MKNKNYPFPCFLWFQEKVSKVKKIYNPDPDPEKIYPGSQSEGVKKTLDPDPQH
jgi:hypothetical protein